MHVYEMLGVGGGAHAMACMWRLQNLNGQSSAATVFKAGSVVHLWMPG